MSNFVYVSSSRFTKFFIKDLFTDELVPCPECVFDEFVIRYRNLYDMEYVTPNVQNFYLDGKLEARRER